MINVNLTIHYDFADTNMTGWATLADVVRRLGGMGVAVTVDAKGGDPLNPVNPPVKGAKPAGNGKPPAVAGPAASDPVVDVSGEPDDADAMDDELGAAALSATEALERGLTLVRTIYNNGHKREVKALQEEFAVAKFADVPVDQGHAFFARVTALAERTGVRV